jgi:hypothetical protein
MKDLLVDPQLRARNERLGSQRASQFTWSRAAWETLNVYYEVAGATKHVVTEKPARISVVPR